MDLVIYCIHSQKASGEYVKSYTVHMVNFNMNKGTFATVEEAIQQARALGFECAIWVNEPGKRPLHLCNVKPY